MRARMNTAGFRRLLAFILSFALVFSGLMGVVAHAGHASGEHDVHVVSASVAAKNLSDGFSGSQHKHVPAGTHHNGMCLDLVCHGGLAVLPCVEAVAKLAVSIIVGRATEHDVSSLDPAPLDRPPSIFRS